MTNLRLLGMVLAYLLAITSTTQAQQRTFVSTSGNDANPCSRELPCRNFAPAVTLVSAGGEVIALDSGGYGAVTINKSVQIISPFGVYAGITAFSGDGILINAGTGDTVVLRGLSLTGLGGVSGIHATSVGALHVEGCVVHGFSFSGIEFGLLNSGQLTVRDSFVRACGANGIVTAGPSTPIRASIDHCRLDKNGFANLNVFQGSRVTIRDSVATFAGSYGFLVQTQGSGLTAELNVDQCELSGNFRGIAAAGNGNTGIQTVRVSNTVITNNTTGLVTTDAGSSILTRTPVTNTLIGNTTDGSFTGVFSAQ